MKMYNYTGLDSNLISNQPILFIEILDEFRLFIEENVIFDDFVRRLPFVSKFCSFQVWVYFILPHCFFVPRSNFWLPFTFEVLNIHKKKLTHFATKSSEIIISFRRAGSTLQKRSLLYKTQLN
jgi:hypothetical protein